MLRIYALASASFAAATMGMGAGPAGAGSMKAASTGPVSGDWDIDTEALGTAIHHVESVGADFFHVDWDSTAPGQGQSRLAGYVYDDDGQPATNVQLQISMLDAAGHEIASVFRPVRGLIPGKGRAYFDVTVPDATSYRVNVDSFDLVEFGPGSPILTGSLDDLRPVAVENRTRNDKERVGSFRRHRLEGAIVLGTLHLDNGKVDAENDLHGPRNHFLDQLQPLAGQLPLRRVYHPRDIAARTGEAGDEPLFHWIEAEPHDDRNCPCRVSCRRNGLAHGDDDIHAELHELSRQRRQPIDLPLCEPPFDDEILTIGVAKLTQGNGDKVW